MEISGWILGVWLSEGVYVYREVSFMNGVVMDTRYSAQRGTWKRITD